MSEYWFKDFTQILNIEKYNKLIPLKEDNYAEKVNSLVRISIVVGLLAALINLNYQFLFLPIATMIITLIAFQYKKQVLKHQLETTKKNSDDEFLNIPPTENIIITSDTIENLKKELNSNNCTPPTKNNVFMNALPYDDRNRYEACDYTENRELKAEMNAMFDIYPTDTQDIFNRNDGRYGFHTTPSTTFPNNRDTFMKWAYGTPLTCKEGNGEQCYANTYFEPESRMGFGNNAVGYVP